MWEGGVRSSPLALGTTVDHVFGILLITTVTVSLRKFFRRRKKPTQPTDAVDGQSSAASLPSHGIFGVVLPPAGTCRGGLIRVWANGRIVHLRLPPSAPEDGEVLTMFYLAPRSYPAYSSPNVIVRDAEIDGFGVGKGTARVRFPRNPLSLCECPVKNCECVLSGQFQVTIAGFAVRAKFPPPQSMPKPGTEFTIRLPPPPEGMPRAELVSQYHAAVPNEVGAGRSFIVLASEMRVLVDAPSSAEKLHFILPKPRGGEPVAVRPETRAEGRLFHISCGDGTHLSRIIRSSDLKYQWVRMTKNCVVLDCHTVPKATLAERVARRANVRDWLSTTSPQEGLSRPITSADECRYTLHLCLELCSSDSRASTEDVTLQHLANLPSDLWGRVLAYAFGVGIVPINSVDSYRSGAGREGAAAFLPKIEFYDEHESCQALFACCRLCSADRASVSDALLGRFITLPVGVQEIISRFAFDVCREGNERHPQPGTVDLVPVTEILVAPKVELSLKEWNRHLDISLRDIAAAQELPSDEKIDWFKEKLDSFKGIENHPVRLNIRREHFLEDSIQEVMAMTPDELRRAWWIDFSGEDSMDACSATRREWYQQLFEEIFEDNFGLWQRACESGRDEKDKQRWKINALSGRRYAYHLDLFRFLGRLLGRALIDGSLVPFLEAHVYKLLLGWPITFEDLNSADEEIYKNLRTGLDMGDEIEEFSLNFSTPADNLGRGTDVEFMAGGSSVHVNADNFPEWLEGHLKYSLYGRVKAQLDELLLGFSEVVPIPILLVFVPKEFEKLLSG